ncbi:hypothetical protein M4E16_002606, partial [Listeria monocytogenes]|nr:hypothetical protein [Listeria monocytogenes]
SLSLSQAELIRVCEDAIKGSILNDNIITQSELLNLIKERMVIYSDKEA